MRRSLLRPFMVVGLTMGCFVLFEGSALADSAEKSKMGEKIFIDRKCDVCHTLSGRGGQVGPDLTGVGKKRDAAWLKKFLPNPRSVSPESMMPPFRGSQEELEALTAYLLSQKS